MKLDSKRLAEIEAGSPVTVWDVYKNCMWENLTPCPMCGVFLSHDEPRVYETLVEHVMDPNAEHLPLRPSYICKSSGCILQSMGFFGYDTEWYTFHSGDTAYTGRGLPLDTYILKALYPDYHPTLLTRVQYQGGVYVGKPWYYGLLRWCHHVVLNAHARWSFLFRPQFRKFFSDRIGFWPSFWRVFNPFSKRYQYSE